MALKGKEFAGQPWWVWAAGGTAVVGALLYILWKSRQAGAAPTPADSATAADGAPLTGLSTGQFQGFITDQQASPSTVQQTRILTVPRAESLAAYAHRSHWTAATYAKIQQLNNLKPSSKLSKGQQILRPA